MKKELIFLICSVSVFVNCSPAKPLQSIKDKDCAIFGGKHCTTPPDVGMKVENLLTQSNKEKDLLMPYATRDLMKTNIRLKRHVPYFENKAKFTIMSENENYDKNYGNDNPIGKFYDGLNQGLNNQDNLSWNVENENDDSDDGFWYNDIKAPQYEMTRKLSETNALNDFMQKLNRRTYEDKKPFDYKKFFFY
ncbi:CLUMA_CG013662, isoform A [Clunio marinus]|uniref:CLUMA_CG013662, isoform A n=1 Tax=Clunio marinus TaxID=568069 RepID=A0A1J1IKV0_9DIPT|nr:CLUMA_CG013662, isoform A [Clunio marinus]